MFSRLTLALAQLLAVVLLSTESRADLMCRGTTEGARLEVHVTPSSVTVALNDVMLAPIGRCRQESRPSTRHLRCAFGKDGLRVEFYRLATTTSGRAIRNGAVVWWDRRPTSVTLDCAE